MGIMILCVYIVFSIVFGSWLYLEWVTVADEPQLWWFPIWVLRDTKDILNNAGYIILCVCNSILLGLGTLIALLMAGLSYLIFWCVALFCWVFRKN